jgi:hypothetical protein
MRIANVASSESHLGRAITAHLNVYRFATTLSLYEAATVKIAGKNSVRRSCGLETPVYAFFRCYGKGSNGA